MPVFQDKFFLWGLSVFLGSLAGHSFMKLELRNSPQSPMAGEMSGHFFMNDHWDGFDDAIYNAARIGVSTKGCTMYLSCGIPCSDCARGIINAGIIRIFCERGDITKGKHWEKNYERSWAMLEEAGINVQFYDDEYGGL